MSSRPGDHFDWTLLLADGASLMLNTAYEADERPAVPDSTRRAGHGDTTLFFGCPNLDEAYEYLRSKGVAVRKADDTRLWDEAADRDRSRRMWAVLSASGEGRLGPKPAAPCSLEFLLD
jgi:hypothetical protein